MNHTLAKEGTFDIERLKDRLVSLGYQEVITYSFIDDKSAALFEPGQTFVSLVNPISAEMSVMRPSLWPGLVAAVKHNRARQQERVRIFESGLRFIQQGNEIHQERLLSGMICGTLVKEQWSSDGRTSDFYDLKADVEALLTLLGMARDAKFEAWVHPALHPGQAARIQYHGKTLGILGMLHPQLARDLELDTNSLLFELQLDGLEEIEKPAFEPLSRFPSVRRDLAIVVDKEVEFSEVEACVRRHGGKILRDILLFDVYTGSKVDLGRKSLAFGLILQDSLRTLTDVEVDACMAGLIAGLGDDLNAKLRD
jgi:phenylalanyl-tRNA synthetase beta chain